MEHRTLTGTRAVLPLALMLLLTVTGVVLSGEEREPAADARDSSDAVSSLDPSLPTEGIDCPMPGILDLPSRLPGPFGVVLHRVIVPGTVEDGRDLHVSYQYVLPEPALRDSRGFWEVTAELLPKRGQAYAALHRQIEAASKIPGPRDWKDLFEKVPVGSALYRSALEERGIHIFGVVRHLYVRVACMPPKESRTWEKTELEAWLGEYEKEALEILKRLVKVIEDAPAAEKNDTAQTVTGISLGKSEAEGSLLEIRVLPAREAEAEESYQLWILNKFFFKRVSPMAEQMRKLPILQVEVPGEFWSSREEVVILRVREEESLTVERIVLQLEPGCPKVTWGRFE